MIKQEGSKWVLYSKDGTKKLGEFDSEDAAKKREAEIQAIKHAKETEPLKIQDTFRIVEAASKDGSVWDVVLLEAGKSANNVNYPEQILSQSVPSFEGAKAFAYEFKGNAADLLDHLPDNVRETNPEGMAKNLVGYYEDVRFGTFPKPNGTHGKGILAKFHVTADWLKETLRNAWKKNKKDLVGFSIDAVAAVKETLTEAGDIVKEVLSFDKIDEVTVVTEPGAGGRLLRLVASTNQNKQKEKVAMNEILKWLKEHFPRLVESVNEDAEPDVLTAKILEALAKVQEGYKEPEQKNEPAQSGITAEQVTGMIQKAEEIKAGKETALVESQQLLKKKVVESTLPEQVQKKILEANKDRKLTEDEINAILMVEQNVLASLQESGLYVPGQEAGNIKVGEEEDEKIQKAMDGMFEGEDIDGIPRFRGLHESYRKLTGFDGNAAQIGRCLLRETAVSLPPMDFADNFSPTEAGKEWKKKLKESRAPDLRRLKEASTLLTTTWTEVFGDSVRRKIMKEYNRPQLQDWKKVVSDIGSAPDFRTNRRIRIGGFGNLATVSENGTYQYIDLPTDEEVSYAVEKRGNLYSLSFESMVNDDLGRIKSLFTKVGVAAIQTIYEYVFTTLISDNPDMDYDSVALFHATSHGANLGSTALADAALDDRIFNMLAQTEQDSGKPLGIRPKYLLVPIELSRVAWEVTRATVSTSGARTETVENWFKQFAIEPIIVNHWTDATDWYMVADPRQYPTIELDFLNGREEPEIFVQDQPTIGSVFTADKVTVKIRHIYGADDLDHRGFDGNVVSG